MQSYWLTFTDGSKGCCEGHNAFDAKTIAEHLTGKTLKTVAGGKYSADIAAEPLPYPAQPIIWQLDHPVYGKTPSFCHRPEQCKGRGCCPGNPACTE